MNIELKRIYEAPEHTEGILLVGMQRFPTIEQEWRDNENSNSCIPTGTYRVEPFTRPNGDHVWILSNPAHDVYQYKEDIPKGHDGRYLILIHKGNTVDDCVGCILPGIGIGIINDKRAVTNSGAAIKRIQAMLREETHELTIRGI